MSEYFVSVGEHASGSTRAKATKADLARGAQLFVGLNCFEPGQSQPVHAHDGADKFYLVLRERRG